MINKVKELLKFKEMIKSLTIKELKTRYKGSFLGFLWTFANPLLQLMVYAIIFPFIMRIKEENYVMFLFVALIPWNFFTNALQGGCGLIVYNSSLVTKVFFPREVLSISSTLSGMCNTFFSYMIVFPMMLLFKIPFSWNILWLPILIFSQAILNLGFSLLVSSINVYFRDLEYLISVGTMALYFMTPIMYDVDILPRVVKNILIYCNPMASYILLYRDILYYGVDLNFSLFGYALLISIVVFFVGWIVFEKLQKGFAEIL